MRHPLVLMRSLTAFLLVVWSLVLSVFVPSVSPFASAPARAASFSVSNLNDSGAGSLRQAITDAAAGADTITFSVSGTMTLASRLFITDTGGLTIDGADQTVTISGNNAVVVFFVAEGASLTLNNLTVTNGSIGFGGAIFNDGGTLTITNSTFTGNAASSAGGAILNASVITPPAGTVTITNSTFSGNSAGSGGGGAIRNDDGTLTITNSTFSGNSTIGSGGGIRNFATASLKNTIVANNTATSSGTDCSGTFTSQGNNLIESTSGCTGFTDGVNGDVAGQDPNLVQTQGGCCGIGGLA